MEEKPRCFRVLWHTGIERPKTRYLKRGFEHYGIEVRKDPRLIRKFAPPTNRLGPYVYPLSFLFEGGKTVTVLFDIGTNPDLFHMSPDGRGRPDFYFKIHIRKGHKLARHKKVRVFPNSVSNHEDYYNLLAATRNLVDNGVYINDLFFVGWNDDKGLRERVVRLILKEGDARRSKWRVYAGLQAFKHHKKVPKELRINRLPFDIFMAWLGGSKLNLAMPGGFKEPWMSFRHVEIWGTGATMLSPPSTCILPGKPGDSWVEFNPNLKHFRELVDHYLNSPDELAKIGQRGRRYFEEYLSPESHARYMIQTIGGRI